MKTMNATFCLLLCTSVAMAQTESTDSLDSSFGAATGRQFTDEQYKAAQDFKHQGLQDKAVKEGCAQKGLQDCNPAAVEEGVLFKGGLGAVIENNISKLYSVVFGGLGFLTGGGSQVTMKAPGTDGKPQKKNDFCIYGATAGEVIAQGMQLAGQSAAQQGTANLNDPQVAALANLKETHKTRKKSATLQSAVYSAVTACYAARLAFGGVKPDPMYIAKMGAAGAIAVLYKAKASKHGNAMKKVQAVIDSLPKAGDCNPYTGTACFCKEKTSEKLYPGQYQEVCVLNGGNADGTVTVSGCAALDKGTVKYDRECKCKENNSCVSTTVKTFNPKFALGSNFANQANQGFDLTQAGTFDEGALNNFTGNANALFNRVKDKLDTSGIPRKKLTDEQKKNALALSEITPAAIAAFASGSEPGTPQAGGLLDGGAAAALDKLPANFKKQLEAEISGNYRSSGGDSSSNAVAEEAPFTMPKFGGEEESSRSGSEVVSFADRAIDSAEVSNRPDTPIFEIISNRYRSSGWNRVQVESP